ncbi:MAG: ribonuclease H-like domain-containing protein [Spirochaetaceae bacterium]|nr:ribonuclease H-like domain-containing protein [Spirochaetaceae bacterium]
MKKGRFFKTVVNKSYGLSAGIWYEGWSSREKCRRIGRVHLKDRLRLIKSVSRKPEAAPETEKVPPLTTAEEPCPAARASEFEGWRYEGEFVYSRTVGFSGTAVAGVGPVPAAGLGALLPDTRRFLASGSSITPAALTFFDLETTGLSGGAGTVAFLAAFGRAAVDNSLAVTQYLLLDYPGEALFLSKCLKNLSGLVVSYNGKSFDSQIIKNRCIMNAVPPPFYHHADLVHPARYLWKRKIPSCRQRDMEELVLGLDRGDDLPGSFAPDAWFRFLKTGQKDNLLKTCAHNISDIAGLAAIWNMFTAIAESPLAAGKQYNADLEHLALRYYNFVKRRYREGHPAPLIIEETATKLLEQAAYEGSEIAQLLWKRKYGTQLF